MPTLLQPAVKIEFYDFSVVIFAFCLWRVQVWKLKNVTRICSSSRHDDTTWEKLLNLFFYWCQTPERREWEKPGRPQNSLCIGRTWNGRQTKKSSNIELNIITLLHHSSDLFFACMSHIWHNRNDTINVKTMLASLSQLGFWFWSNTSLRQHISLWILSWSFPAIRDEFLKNYECQQILTNMVKSLTFGYAAGKFIP